MTVKKLSVSLPEEAHEILIELAEDHAGSISAAIAGLAFDHAYAKMGIGELAEAKLVEGLTNQEVLEEVMRRHPTAGTSASSIKWYRSSVRRNKPELGVVSEMEARRRQS